MLPVYERPPSSKTGISGGIVKRRAFILALWCAGPLLAAEPGAGLQAGGLQPRSGPRGATMFAQLPPADTGVLSENRYADPRMWGERFHEFEVGAIGTGVAIGDYDNDGRPDIFIVSKTESCRLFRNLGHWKFEDVTERAGVGDQGAAAAVWKQGAAFADVNNDGWLDLYVCRFAEPNRLYINQGNGSFKEEAAARGLAVVDACGTAMFCDYDRDGWLDAYVQTNLLDATRAPNGQRDHLFRNNGDGTFRNVTDAAGVRGETQGHSAIWWDYDQDGWPDLYVANDFAAPDSLYRNNRDGTFTDVINEVVPHVPFSAMGSDLADLNNDGWMDLFVPDMAATTHQKDMRSMADVRGRTKEPPDRSDVVPQYLRNALFLNTGTGFCLEAAYLAGLAATDWTWSPRFEDLDNDGRVDLHVTTGMHREAHNADMLLRVMMSENPAERVRIEKNSPVLMEANIAYRNLGDLRFANVAADWGLGHRGVSFGSAFGDLDGDGDLDLVYTNYEKPATVLRNDSDTGHRLIVALRGTRSNRFGIGAAVRIETTSGVQLRHLVATRGYLSTSEPVLHFGLGGDARIERLEVTWPSGEVQTLAGLAADQRLTITESDTGAMPPRERARAPAGQFRPVTDALNLAVVSGEIAIDEIAQQPLLTTKQNRRGPALAIGDLDGDGREDVVAGGTPRTPAELRVRRGEAGFAAVDSAALVSPAPLSDGPVVLFDADGDGDQDLLVTRSGVGLPAGVSEFQPRLWLNDGRANWTAAPADALPPLPISAGAAVAADFDRDGRLDLFLGGRVLPGQYPYSSNSALLLNRDGRFEDVTGQLAPALRTIGLVTSALATDVDGDGWIDLLVAVEWGGIRYWRNAAGTAFVDTSVEAGFAAAGTGWWNSLAAADFNGDGRMDYVAGNQGLNTPYHATPTHPAVLFVGEFSDSGVPQLIEGYYEGDTLFPRRNRRQLGAQIPAVLKKYPRNDFYARATLAEILGAERLEAAERFEATELRSGVFLSRPDATWRFAPLPQIAQVSPFHGVAAGDFDGDGFADIYAVQNSHAPMAVVGRFDGGLSQLLRGDGRGGFAPVGAAESGLIVTGDARALVVTDLDDDGWPDFLVSRNSGDAVAFANGGVPGRRMLRVSLRAATGNPTAVGALVSLVSADGGRQMSEVSAGSGYFSQSSPSCFFGVPPGPAVVSVRWPSGRVTEQTVPEGGRLNLVEP